MAVPKFLSGIDLTKTELQNAVIQVLAADPSSPVLGQLYYNSGTNKLRQYNGSTWTEYGTSTASGDVSQASNSGGAGRLKVSAGATKVITDYATAGIVKSDGSGVASAAVAGTDYTSPTSTETFTNKTFSATGTGNTISNLGTSNFAVNVVDTDTALTSNSDTRIPSQKAVKAYVDAVSTSEMTFKGGIDASTNPNYPAAALGDVYRITVAGLIGGGSGVAVGVGDTIIAAAANVGGTQAAVGANWTILQANVDAATTSTQGLVTLATNAEALAKSVSTKAVTPAALVGFTQKFTATIGDGSTAAIAVSDNLGTLDKIAQVRDATSNAMVLVDVTYASNTTTFTFATAPASNSYKVVIIG